MRHPIFVTLLSTLWGLTACDDRTLEKTTPERFFYNVAASPAETPASSCWEKTITPAEFTTLTTHRLIAADNDLEKAPKLATYQTETNHLIIQEQRNVWVQTTCPDKPTPVLP